MHKKNLLSKIFSIKSLCFFAATIFIVFGIIVWLLLYRTGNQSLYQLATFQRQKPLTSITLNQWNDFREKYLTIVEDQNPRVALEKLREEIKTNDLLSRNCHELTHEIGHLSLKKYKTFGNAIQYQDDVCGSGYMHGVLESYFDENKNNISFALNNACSVYPKNNYEAWECYHGIGHGIMFANVNNVPESIKLCKKLKNDFADSACENGVFMQNFTTDAQIHPSRFLSKSNFFYPCAEQLFQTMSNCYLYAPSYFLKLHNYNYQEALTWCNEAPYLFINTCRMGVGSEMMKQNINNPKFVETICRSQQNDGLNDCIEGMTSMYILHYGSLISGKNLCKTMNSEDKIPCQKTVSSFKSMFI